MSQDFFSTGRPDWTAAESGGPATAPLPPALRVQRPDEQVHRDRAGGDDGARLRRLLWIFALLTIVLVAPSIVARFEYARIAAQERARLDIARENLKDFNLDQISAGFRMLAHLVGPSVVNIRTEVPGGEGQGSGVIVDDDGYIVTNEHVVRGARMAEIQLSDGRRGSATVVGVDWLTDIAVLKTGMKNLVAADWGDSDKLQVGDIVWALGSPFGLQKSITFGILSAKERRGIIGTRVIREYLQTDAAVNPGNSGGPLVNGRGEVVGINTAIIGPAYQGISFAVPSALARDSYEKLRAEGYVSRGFLGINPGELPDELADELGLKRNGGVLVLNVSLGTPALDAGLRAGDVITKWNGEEFTDPTVLSRAIAATAIGEEVPVTVVRNTPRGPREMEINVRVGARPPDTED